MKNKKAKLTILIKTALWIIFIVIAIGGVVFLTTFLTNQ